MGVGTRCDIGGCIKDALYVIEEKLGGVVVYKNLCAMHWLGRSS